MEIGLKLGIGQDLQLAGTNSEFVDIDNPNGYIYREVFWVQATLNDGSRFDHYFITSDFEKVKKLLERMESGKVDLTNRELWAYGNPVYGSEAYIREGAENTLD